MKLKKSFAHSAMIATLALSSNAFAAFTFTGGGYCSDPSATPGISVSDMTLNGGNATDCFGVVEGRGGNVQDGSVAINALDWDVVVNGTDSIKDDGSGSVQETFLGFNWTLAADNGSSSSDYTLTVQDLNGSADPNLPITTDIIAYLKAGNDGDLKKAGAFFLFEDVVINTDNAGTFQISWTTGGSGGNPGLSGMTLFIGEPGGGGDPGGSVPAPGTLALLGLPMLGLIAVRRRKKK